jgi:hypothetical protein
LEKKERRSVMKPEKVFDKTDVVIFIIFLILITVTLVFAQEKKGVSYPTGYRDWTHVKSMLIFDQKHPLFNPFGGLHHIYVNPKGLSAYKKGGNFPDGTLIVFDLLEANMDQGAYVEGLRKFIGVMQKDSKRFRETAGWGFDAFEKDTKNSFVKDGGKSCFECHMSQKEKDYVFSNYRP